MNNFWNFIKDNKQYIYGYLWTLLVLGLLFGILSNHDQFVNSILDY